MRPRRTWLAGLGGAISGPSGNGRAVREMIGAGDGDSGLATIARSQARRRKVGGACPEGRGSGAASAGTF